jgi:thiamine transport system ATP-binding protein
VTSGLEVRALTVTFGATAVLDQFDLIVGIGEIVAVMGPSGAGKSTLLRAVAGLQPIVSGRIDIAGTDVTTVPTHRRKLGFVFQDLALFPHLNVGENIAYGLRRQHMSAGPRRERVGELLDLIGLAGFARRAVDTLSGGEQQRVALARALAPRPRLLLLDEPLAALDEDRKLELTTELRRIITTTGVTALHVTHDADEARRIADRVVMMRPAVHRLLKIPPTAHL